MPATIEWSIEELIVRLFEHPDTVLSQAAFDRLGEAGEVLRRSGAIVQTDNLASITCRECGEDHPVEIEFDPTRERSRYYCGSVGFVDVEPRELGAFAVNPGWLPQFLRERLITERPKLPGDN